MNLWRSKKKSNYFRNKNYISDENIYTEKYSKYQVYYYSDSSSIETISNNNKLSIVKFNEEIISSIKHNIDENNDIIIIKIDIKLADYPVPSVLIFAIDKKWNILNIPSSTNIIVERLIVNTIVIRKNKILLFIIYTFFYYIKLNKKIYINKKIQSINWFFTLFLNS